MRQFSGARSCTFKETDLKRVFRAAQAAGVAVKIKIGKMTVTMDNSKRVCGRAAADNEWDEVFDGNDGNDQT